MKGKIELLSSEKQTWLTCKHETVVDMKNRFVKYGSLSDRQWNYMKSLWEQEYRRENEPAGTPIPEDLLSIGGRHVRVDFVGIIVALKTQQTDFGPTLKMLISDYRGFKIWGSVPKALAARRGDCVQITAKLFPKKDKPDFGFFSRPSAPKILKKREDMKNYKESDYEFENTVS